MVRSRYTLHNNCLWHPSSRALLFSFVANQHPNATGKYEVVTIRIQESYITPVYDRVHALFVRLLACLPIYVRLRFRSNTIRSMAAAPNDSLKTIRLDMSRQIVKKH